jgi:hypothetical protein
MAAGDVTVATPFHAGDTTAAKANVEALSIVSGDLVITWQENNEVYVAKIKTA